MTEILYRADAWVTALALLVVMVVAWQVGRWFGRRMAARGAGIDDKILEASLALMGLLLGFTFAIALDKHGKRREAVVLDSNAIGDFYTTASMIPDQPLRTQLERVIREYAEYRLRTAVERPLNEESLDAAISEFNRMHTRMTELVSQTVPSNAKLVIPLVNNLNNLTSSHAIRLAAARDRLPFPIVSLLAVAMMVSLGLVGRGQGLEGKKHTVSTIGFIVMVSFALYLTIDLNQPQRGLLRVSQEPLERLIATMK